MITRQNILRMVVAALVAVTICLSATPTATAQQNDKKIEEQRRVIADLERAIARDQKQLASLKKNKASAEKQVQLLVRQIDQRSSLIAATSRQIRSLAREIDMSERRIGVLSSQGEILHQSCRDMARAAWRNYRFSDMTAYLFSAESFADMARRMASLRVATEARQRAVDSLASTRKHTEEERERLMSRREELSKTKADLERRRADLRKDLATAKRTVQSMSKKERDAMQAKLAKEQKLDKAVAELRRLTKGNKSGASFSAKTSGLQVPVAGGKVRRYNGNMAEITGGEGATVTSVYEGKVMKVGRNKVTARYEVYIAHGEYITTYANLASTSVKAGDTVARNARIGTIGSRLNPSTMEIEHCMTFSVFAPSDKVTLRAADLFKK